jgi:CTP synthase (UTP-ammonia lyase)
LPKLIDIPARRACPERVQLPYREGTMNPIRLALVGDYNSDVPAHQAIPKALRLSGDRLGVAVEPVWMHTATLDVSQLAAVSGIWCVPASPYASTDNALGAIRFARETRRPFLGTCGGFQHALLEYTHNVLGHPEADHAETSPDAAMLLISRLSCSLVEQRRTVALAEGSRLRTIFGTDHAEEEYRCNYGLNPQYESILRGALQVAARDGAGEVRAIELTGHPFFVATLFQPERAALRGAEHPLVTAFVEAAGKVDRA